MFYVYILRLSNNRLYIGSTGDIKNRIVNHKKGLSPYTSKYLPLKLIYFECYANKTDAIKRERFLKTGRGREVIKKQLENTLNI